MTPPAFVTRDQADPRNLLIEQMSEAAYEAEKDRGSSLPPWAAAEPTYRDRVRRGIGAALGVAERAGWGPRE